MNKLVINTGKETKIYIGNLSKEEFLEEAKGYKKAAIVYDENIDSRYVSDIGNLLEEDGTECIALSIKGGEKCKTIETYERVISYLLKFNVGRYDLIIGMGGGSTLDLTGFVASTFLRGVNLINIPTTLLAMVDSSIGGKNGINFSSIKNMVGTIYQPKAVFCNLPFLRTLSEKEFRQGVAEIIKISACKDASLFYKLKENKLNIEDMDYLKEVITRAISLKGDVIKEDVNDLDSRHILNFGHTFGHQIESGTNFKVSHGDSISIGMIMELKKINCDSKIVSDIEENLKKNKLLTKSPLDIRTIYKGIKYDKKRKGDKITLTKIDKIGSSSLVEVDINEFK